MSAMDVADTKELPAREMSAADVAEETIGRTHFFPSLLPTPRQSRKMMRDGFSYDFIWL